MITFLNLGKYGRLGNQLFQYAALRAAGLRNNFEVKLPNYNNYVWHGQQCLLKNFNINLPFLTQNDLTQLKYNIEEPNKTPGKYFPILEEISDFSNLNGFFQNTKYFIDFKDLILEDLSLKKEILEEQQKYLNKFRNSHYHLVSLHIRTGDMIDGTNPIYEKYYGQSPFDKNSIFGKYLIKCLDFYFDKKVKFIIFVGGSRSGNDSDDIIWAKKHFFDDKFVVSESNDPIVDMARISLCDDNIVSFSSTFSWWAAFINKNKEKKVFCPKNFHFDNKEQERDGFYPKEWNLI